ncbi:MAG TPA: TlpA disulfide reductase family protein [Candidatus Polarisedimenticolia bacterium]|jgi:thiol-disulfide isomerase/thioredoxin|nr:TlpA disulfide reductase family protein [Candidatus Polarisedimenticolia bacterium]
MKPDLVIPAASRWLLAALLTVPSCAAAAAAKPAGPPVDPYSKVVLEDTQGRAIQLGRYAGKVRLFDIWASWCGPCRMGIPHLNRLYDRYRDRGLVVIGVSVDDRPADVEAFVRVTPIKYPSGMMNPGLAKLLGNTDAVPTSLLVDRHGKMRRKFVGYVEPELMEREIAKFLTDSQGARAGP